MAQQKKTIVALHGAGMHAGVWTSLAGGIDLPCQGLSFPGHGDKADEMPLPSIEQMAVWVQNQLALHPPRSVTLMGHSMGALVALEAAAHPAVSSLVLLGAAARMPVHAGLLKQAAENPEAAADMILKWGISSAHPQAEVLKTILKEQMKVPAGVLHNDLNACNIYQHGDTAAKEISLPVLVMAGLDDKMTRSTEGKILADMMPQAQFHILADCGHMMMSENPAETAAEINSFIKSLAG